MMSNWLNHLGALPKEVFNLIVSNLSITDAIRVSSTSKKFREYIWCDGHFWHTHFVGRYSPPEKLPINNLIDYRYWFILFFKYSVKLHLNFKVGDNLPINDEYDTILKYYDVGDYNQSWVDIYGNGYITSSILSLNRIYQTLTSSDSHTPNGTSNTSFWMLPIGDNRTLNKNGVVNYHKLTFDSGFPFLSNTIFKIAPNVKFTVLKQRETDIFGILENGNLYLMIHFINEDQKVKYDLNLPNYKSDLFILVDFNHFVKSIKLNSIIVNNMYVDQVVEYHVICMQMKFESTVKDFAFQNDSSWSHNLCGENVGDYQLPKIVIALSNGKISFLGFSLLTGNNIIPEIYELHKFESGEYIRMSNTSNIINCKNEVLEYALEKNLPHKRIYQITDVADEIKIITYAAGKFYIGTKSGFVYIFTSNGGDVPSLTNKISGYIASSENVITDIPCICYNTAKFVGIDRGCGVKSQVVLNTRSNVPNVKLKIKHRNRNRQVWPELEKYIDKWDGVD